MAIFYDEKNGLFHLQTPDTSYIIGLYEGKVPLHLYYGKKLTSDISFEDLFEKIGVNGWGHGGECADFEKPIQMSRLPLECPGIGDGDVRPAVFQAKYEDGSILSKLWYQGYRITAGKPAIPGLPSAYVEDDSEAQTLELYLRDEYQDISVTLVYTAYTSLDVITRSMRITNGNKGVVKLNKVLSGCIELQSKDYDFIHFYGSWARERYVERKPLFIGDQHVDSLLGSSGHHQNPFICLASHGATEDSGEVYGANLVYSGSFISGVYVDPYYRTRLYIGINPENFEWKLECGEEFCTPECVFVYSCEGIGKMSRTYHKLIRDRVSRGRFRGKERPILINNWEATYFNFDEELIVKIAKKAAEVGVDMMVLADGWFGSRDDDTTSLGDWFPDKKKLPDGISGLAKKINDIGMKFGLWFEPEMISPVSKLYEAHPDWCLHVEGRSRSLSRNQLILDYSRADVREYIIDTMTALFDTANIEYIKWDMNRNMSEIGSALLPADRQGEVAHRYMLGLYSVLETLKNKYPHILMEGCAGGGGRFDMGMLHYFDQIWTSDDSDAVERLTIQNGTSYCYPSITMGAHVAKSPNGFAGRATTMSLRGYVALAGQFGYELDLNKLSDEDIEVVKEQIALCRQYRNVFHRGDMYRLMSSDDSCFMVWEFVSEDKNTVIVDIFTTKAVPYGPPFHIKLSGIDSNASYKDKATGRVYTGEYLINIGLTRHADREYDGEMLILERINCDKL